MKLYKKTKEGKLIIITVPDYNSYGIGTVSSNSSTGGSIDFSSLNSYFSVAASNDWAIGTGDFTIEWLQYQTSSAAGRFPRVFSVKAHPLTSIGVSIESGTFYLWIGADGIGYFGNSLSNYLNQWVHFAITRNGSSIKLFQNGTLLNTITNTNNVSNTTDPLIIGDDFTNEALSRFPGYITNFRFIKGTSIYNSAFIRPSSPLSNITNTKLLLLATTQTTVAADSTGTKTITSTNPTWNTLSPF
jgi:hypothetical protein